MEEEREMRKLLCMAFIGLSSVPVMATDDLYYQIKSIEVTQISDESAEPVSVFESSVRDYAEQMVYDAQHSTYSRKNSEIGAVIAIIDELIALGEKIYVIVKRGEPVVNINYAPISVLPKTTAGKVIEPMKLAHWSQPKTMTYQVNFKNYMGMTPVSFKYMLIFSHSGSYKGKGKYLTGAQVMPLNVDVAWGYDFDATMQLNSIVNHGSEKDAVAGALLVLNYKVGTALKKSETNATFYINGAGEAKRY